MIDKRFSSEAFDKLAQDSKEKEALLKDLGDEIASLLNEAASKTFNEIASSLIKLGHNLEEQAKEYDPEFHSTGYEYLNPNNENDVRIWLQTQTSAMAGYKTLGEIENEEESA